MVPQLRGGGGGGGGGWGGGDMGIKCKSPFQITNLVPSDKTSCLGIVMTP